MGINNKETFKYYYNLEVSNNRNPCGPGSEAETVKRMGTIDFINDIIKEYKIKSISDCPSGLFENWMYLVDLENVKYIGYDINNLVVERNKSNYPDISFFELDMVNEKLPYTDLIICRDCFFHLSNSFVLSTIENFRNSGSTYLLSTHHRELKINNDLTKSELECEAGYRAINLEIEPYGLGSPMENHNENVKKYYKPGNNRQMSLWKLNCEDSYEY